MRKLWVYIIIYLNFIRCFPHLIIFLTHRKRKLIEADTLRWLKIIGKNYRLPFGFIYLLGFFPEFRNLLYNRIGFPAHFLNLFCPKMSTLRIITRNIGEGLYINHGMATSISAESIGKNCWIGHQVSVGYYKGFPTILDNVTINAGAVVLGKITIGNNVIIGANATVITDIPDNCTVFPPASRIMRWNTRNDKKGPFTVKDPEK